VPSLIVGDFVYLCADVSWNAFFGDEEYNVLVTQRHSFSVEDLYRVSAKKTVTVLVEFKKNQRKLNGEIKEFNKRRGKDQREEPRT